MRDAENDFQKLGLTLVVVGNGAPESIAGFRDKTGFRGALYTDPQLAAYRALKLSSGLRSNLNWRTMRRAIGAYARGNRQTWSKPLGKPWQQGGVFVVTKAGEIAYSYSSSFAGDHPPISELLVAATTA